MKITVLLSIVLSLMIPSVGYSSKLLFDQAGFEIDVLESQTVTGSVPLMMSLKPENGFGDNINVQVQPYEGTLAGYKNLSEAQFTNIGLDVIVSEIKGKSLIFEYSGKAGKNEYHWYSRAVKKGNSVYLITATSLDLNWPANKNKLISTVDSFNLK